MAQPQAWYLQRVKSQLEKRTAGKGKLFSSLKLASYLIFSPVGVMKKSSVQVWPHCPKRAQLKRQKQVMRMNAWLIPQQDDAEAKLKAVSSYGQGPSLLYVCSASSTIGFSRCYCNTKNKQYSYSEKSVSSILTQFVKNHLTWILNKHFKYILKPFDVKVFGKIQTDELISCSQKSSPRRPGKPLTIFFKQDTKTFNKQQSPSDTGRVNNKIIISVGLVSAAHRQAVADSKSQVTKGWRNIL